MKTFTRSSLWLGIGGTLLMILVGASRAVAAAGLPDAEVFIGSLVIIMLILSPYRGALRQQAKSLPGRGDVVILLLSAVFVVGVAAYFYLSEFVILPLHGIRPRATGSGMLMVIVPLFQWVGIGITGLLRTVNTRMFGPRS